MSVLEIKSPVIHDVEYSTSVSVFLAGAIDMGNAEEWQKEVVDHFSSSNDSITFYNPRRDDWDSSWKQHPDDPKFFEQVSWELNYIMKSDIVFMAFTKNSKAPISLLEFGLVAGMGKTVVLYCHPEFYRYGNVAITADAFGIDVYSDLETAINELTVKTKNLMGKYE